MVTVIIHDVQVECVQIYKKLYIFVLRAILGKPLYSLDKEDEEGLYECNFFEMFGFKFQNLALFD